MYYINYFKKPFKSCCWFSGWSVTSAATFSARGCGGSITSLGDFFSEDPPKKFCISSLYCNTTEYVVQRQITITICQLTYFSIKRVKCSKRQRWPRVPRTGRTEHLWLRSTVAALFRLEWQRMKVVQHQWMCQSKMVSSGRPKRVKQCWWTSLAETAWCVKRWCSPGCFPFVSLLC